MCTYTFAPNTRSLFTFGFCSFQISNGVLLESITLAGLRLVKNAAVWIAAPHNFLLTLLSSSIERVFSTSVRFIRSLAPFCSGVYGIVHSITIPFCLQKSVNALFLYSPPLSQRNRLIPLPNLALAIASYSRNFSTTSFFERIKKTTTNRLQSSMKETKYFSPFMLTGVTGPQTSECTSSKTPLVRLPSCVGKGSRVCFPAMHDSHTVTVSFFFTVLQSSPTTILLRESIDKFFALKWPYRRCQSSNSLGIWPQKYNDDFSVFSLIRQKLISYNFSRREPTAINLEFCLTYTFPLANTIFNPAVSIFRTESRFTLAFGMYKTFLRVIGMDSLFMIDVNFTSPWYFAIIHSPAFATAICIGFSIGNKHSNRLRSFVRCSDDPESMIQFTFCIGGRSCDPPMKHTPSSLVP
ncbi:uncharacterized protein LOC131692547 [Topomyia yanbarensis]|uniref:uncharacterized protein LOC131692547 n=1 Tax=Topomyia yanbarensis TaxID=2498891 RepID=UPI00273B3E42|nr:uncharacterized protein LOC131692547 [Topomyia yanbarensis]